MSSILVGSVLMVVTWSLVSAQGCDKLTIKFDQLEGFFYGEFCGGLTTLQRALLGSGRNLDCGVNGTKAIGSTQIRIVDETRPSFTLKLCLNVHGVDDVEITYVHNFTIVNVHSEDLTSSTGWTSFCTSLKNQLADTWEIQLVSKLDGSKVMVKNSKLTLCTPQPPLIP